MMLLAGVVAACASGPEVNVEDNIPSLRKGELGRLFDQTGSFDEATAQQATDSVLTLPAEEQDYIDLLWGGRTGEGLHAHRLGLAYMDAAQSARANSLTDAANLERAVRWFRRAILAVDVLASEENRLFAARIRFDLARAYICEGKLNLAVELLANRTDTTPLPPDVQQSYDGLLDEIALIGAESGVRNPGSED